MSVCMYNVSMSVSWVALSVGVEVGDVFVLSLSGPTGSVYGENSMISVLA